MIKKIQDKKIFKFIVFAVVLLIPVIYSFFYLKSYWDPYGHLSDLKVGIVNLDNGNGEENRGNELVKELKESGTLNFVDCPADEANKGLGNDEYYAVITIPSNFTETLNSASTEDKQISTIIYTPNKRKNYLASQILNTALKTVEINLQGKVSREVTATLSDNLKEVPSNLEKIADGANKLNNGATDLTNGIQTLSDGVNTLDVKYSEFDNGVNSAYEGSKTLANGTSQISSGIGDLKSGASKLNVGVSEINEALNDTDLSKIGKLTSGIVKLDDGVNKKDGLKNGINSYVTGSESIANGVISLDQTLDSEIAKYTNIYMNSTDATTKMQAGAALQALKSVKSGINDTSKGKSLVGGSKELTATDSKTKLTSGGALKAGINEVSAGTEELNNATGDIKNLGSSINELKVNLQKVQAGTTSLTAGMSDLQNGNAKVKVGAEQLTSGLETLNESSTSVKNALTQLNNGSQTALDGSKKLQDGTEEFKNEINEGLNSAKDEIKKLDNLDSYVEDPIKIEEQSYGEVDSYGVAFAPLFISIGLWVGALMCYVVLYYDQRHRFGILDHDTKKSKILQDVIYLAIGAIDGILTGLVLKAGLGFSVNNMMVYLGECMLAGLVFMSVIQFLIRNFGDIGKLLALIILVLQLAASGGTFPVETIDNGFKGFTSILPMTYTIRAFRDTLIITDNSLIAKNTWILVGIFVCLNILSIIIEIIKSKIINEKNKTSNES